MKIKILPMLMVIVLMVPVVVAAATENPCSNNGDLGQCVSKVYIWSLGVSALLAVAMIIFGGYLVMSARGNAAQATKGKSFLFSSLVGMVLLMAAYLLLNTINTELTDFSTPAIENFINGTTTQPNGQTTTPTAP